MQTNQSKQERATSVALFLFATTIRPGWQPWAISQNKQASKQAQEPLILSLWQSLIDKKLMALVLACMG